MPIDFQQIYTAIQVISRTAPARQKALAERQAQAWQCFQQNAEAGAALRSKLAQVVSASEPNLRCAIPGAESLMAARPAPAACPPATLIAVDGSQIVPDRHQSITYGLINIGAVCLRLGAPDAPQIVTETELLYDDSLRNRDGSLIDEGGIALRRDARERSVLLELASKVAPPVIALTDGPVELWGAKDPANAASYRTFLQGYLRDLDGLHERGVTLGGLVVKPAADLLVRLLELARADDEQVQKLSEFHPFLGVTDLWLFSRLLKAGERSAVFALQSSSRARYTGSRAIHFFYLNISALAKPVICRVECPAWVAEDPAALDLLHAALLQQSRLLGASPYPYILHRAHETARVAFDERGQVELLLGLELHRQGESFGEPSTKQSAKDRPGRQRK